MTKRWLVVVAVLVGVALFVFFTSGPPRPTPNRPGAAFSFAVMGDAPYTFWDERKMPEAIADVAQNDVAFVIHVGDIFWRPCTDEMYRAALARFDAMRHPVYFTPGDNEWTDCWEPGSGSYKPQERLARLRQIFYAHPPQAERQPGYVENARWEYGGVLFATADIPGSKNGMRKFPGRTADDDVANFKRTSAGALWVHETFAVAKQRNAKAVVIGFQANMDLEKPPNAYQKWFQPFLSTLEEEAKQFGKPVLAVHGDGHIYWIDRPFAQIPNFQRLQTQGSPTVGWVRVFVTPDAREPFAFEEHTVPLWKYW